MLRFFFARRFTAMEIALYTAVLISGIGWLMILAVLVGAILQGWYGYRAAEFPGKTKSGQYGCVRCNYRGWERIHKCGNVLGFKDLRKDL